MLSRYDAVITGTGSFTPERVLTNADLEKMVDTTDEWITTRTGIKERRIADKETAASDLCLEATKKAMDEAKITPEELDLICSGYGYSCGLQRVSLRPFSGSGFYLFRKI
jgi:3-oxoacyl-[acyl-carrier-protein] synthase-3